MFFKPGTDHNFLHIIFIKETVKFLFYMIITVLIQLLLLYIQNGKTNENEGLPQNVFVYKLLYIAVFMFHLFMIM